LMALLSGFLEKSLTLKMEAVHSFETWWPTSLHDATTKNIQVLLFIHYINTLTTEVLNHVLKCNSYLTENTCHRYNCDWLIQLMETIAACFKTIRSTQIHCVGKMQSFIMLKQVVHIVTIGI
jgi:hypothetical protein